MLFGKYKLPVYIKSVIYSEYELIEKTYSKEEAVDLSFIELKNKLDVLLNDKELISRSIETSFDENGFYIACKIECIENIAKEVRIFKE